MIDRDLFLILVALPAAIISRLIAGAMDRGRIREYVESSGGKVRFSTSLRVRLAPAYGEAADASTTFDLRRGTAGFTPPSARPACSAESTGGETRHRSRARMRPLRQPRLKNPPRPRSRSLACPAERECQRVKRTAPSVDGATRGNKLWRTQDLAALAVRRGSTTSVPFWGWTSFEVSAREVGEVAC
jgi:hypothetical protein